MCVCVYIYIYIWVKFTWFSILYSGNMTIYFHLPMHFDLGVRFWLCLVDRNVFPCCSTTKNVDSETRPTFVNQRLHSATLAVCMYVRVKIVHISYWALLLALTLHVGEGGRKVHSLELIHRIMNRNAQWGHPTKVSLRLKTAALQNMIHALPASSVTGTIHKGLLKAIEWFFCVYTECASLLYLTGGSKRSHHAGHSIDVEIQTWKGNISFLSFIQ